MFPIIEIGGLHISAYQFLMSLALVVCGMLGLHRLIRGGNPAYHVVRGMMLTIWGGIAGAFVLRGLVLLLQNFFLTGTLAWRGGSAFVGTLIGGIGAALFYIQRHGFPLGRSFDLGCIVVPLGQVIGRLGCFAAGCCGGRATDSWLGMYLPDTDGVWMVRYPTQLMSAAANLAIFITLLIVERYGKRRQDKPEGARIWPFDGFLFLLYVDLYCLKRFIIEFLRNDNRLVIGPISWAHLYTVVSMLVVTTIIFWNLRRTVGGEIVSKSGDRKYDVGHIYKS
jgi:phosphatidylglycerol:prolipoprotein diacylglycerol transferase